MDKRIKALLLFKAVLFVYEDFVDTKNQSFDANTTFTGNIYLFHAFDVGDDIDLKKISTNSILAQVPLTLPKYFKNYHMPLAVSLPHLRPNEQNYGISCKIHDFGAISLTYQIPFESTLELLLKDINKLINQNSEASISDTKWIFQQIKSLITEPHFFQMNTSYVVIQVNPIDGLPIAQFKKEYANTIASLLRFETESLSDYQKNEIIESAIGYFRGDIIIVDTDATFLYDEPSSDVLNLFEFANIQQVELRYFDRALDKQLNKIYESQGRNLPLLSYIPFTSTIASDPIARLSKLKVDISVITERLENSIKLAGEPYFSEIHDLIAQNLDLPSWRHSIDRKLSIIHDALSTYQDKIDVVRSDLLSVLVIILILLELILGLYRTS